MSWLSEAHNDWHTANGWDRVCPLDCGAGEVWDDEEDFAEAEA